MSLWRLIELDYSLGEQVERGEVTIAERERRVARMAQILASDRDTTPKAPWESDVYVVAFHSVKTVKAKFYRPESHMRDKHGEPTGFNGGGYPYWEIDGKKEYADGPERANQFSLVFEVLEGDKKGDWLFVFAPTYVFVNKDGEWAGKLYDILSAAGVDPLSLVDGVELKPYMTLMLDDSDLECLRGIPVRVAVKPKDNPEYAKVESWMAVKKADAKKYAAPAAPAEFVPATADDDAIPF